MPTLSQAFLNCHNLRRRAKVRSKRKTVPLAVKSQRLAQVLVDLGLSSPPAFIGFCELNEAALGVTVATTAFPTIRYQPL